MILARTVSEPATARHLYQGRDGHSAWVTPFFGTETMADPNLPRPPENALYPVAFMVEEAAHARLGAHFHRADQFQVFVGGDGHFGNAAIRPLCVHLASAFTPYGPITAGEHGLAYLTLRNGFDPGPRYMPQAEAELRRDRTARPHQRLIALPPVDVSISQADVAVLDNGPDTWGIWLRRYPAHSEVRGKAIAGGGQYWVITRGSARVDGVLMGPLSCLFAAADGTCPTIVAQHEDVEILVLQFASRSP
jgi:hypothetical protein